MRLREALARPAALAAAAAALTPLVGLLAVALVPIPEPDAALKARVQAWRDAPRPERPGRR